MTVQTFFRGGQPDEGASVDESFLDQFKVTQIV